MLKLPEIKEKNRHMFKGHFVDDFSRQCFYFTCNILHALVQFCGSKFIIPEMYLLEFCTRLKMVLFKVPMTKKCCLVFSSLHCKDH